MLHAGRFYSFEFNDFKEAMRFVNEVARVSEEEGQHPSIHLYYNKVEFGLHPRSRAFSKKILS
ncbi:MAG: 4a-hydroxytetrahydrobiopterin dehydratase [Methanobacteriota archaeon]